MLENKFKIYKIKLSSDSEEFKNLKVNKFQTFEEQCKQKRRPRLSFKEIKNQLKEHIKLVFNDTIYNLK